MNTKKTVVHSHYIVTVDALPIVRNFGTGRQYYACECGDGQGAVNTAIQPAMVDFYDAVNSNAAESINRASLRHWLHKNGQGGVGGSDPMADTVQIPDNPIKTGDGEAWALPKTAGQLCDCSKLYFEPHTVRTVMHQGAPIMAGQLCQNVSPSSRGGDYQGYNVRTAPALSSLDAAGVYMPDINLHSGFNSVVDKARDSLKRELIRKERKPLFKAFVRACNAYQLVQLPNQSTLPFSICGGTVWDATGGRMNRFSIMVDNAMLKLFGRHMTIKEGIFIKQQWPALTRARRASGSPIRETRNESDFVSVSRTMGEIWKRGAEHTKAVILAGAQGTRADNSLGALHFDYRSAVSALRKRLAAGEITHAYYNELYAMLKNKRQKQLDILETVADKNMRNEHKNSGAVRVVHNASGMAPGKASNVSKRFAYDDYPVTDDDDDGTIVIENVRSPTVYKDGIVTNKDSRTPIIMKKKKAYIKK